jgi:hypothetical protein
VGLAAENVSDGAFANLTRLVELAVNLNPALTAVRNAWFPAPCSLATVSFDSNGLVELPVPFLQACATTLADVRLRHNALARLPRGLLGIPYPVLTVLFDSVGYFTLMCSY